MNATIALSNRIAAGVTAGYVRDLTRRPAETPGDGGRARIRVHRVAAAATSGAVPACGPSRTRRGTCHGNAEARPVYL